MVLEKIVIAVNDFRLPFVDDNREKKLDVCIINFGLHKVVSNRWTDL